MSNSISRQDAIDAIYEAFCYAYCDNCDNNGKRWSDDDFACDECYRKYQNWKASRKTVESTINALPSAEPEIIRCKECKFWTHIKRTNRYWCKTDDGLYDLNPSPDDFCSRAERRTDCGAKMEI